MTNRASDVIPTADERLAMLPPPPERAVRRVSERNRKLHLLLMFSALGLGIALMAAALAWGTRGELTNRADANQRAAASAEEKADQATAQASTAAAAAAEANRRLRAAGKPTVPVPTIIPVQPTPDGLSASQIETVRAVISNELVSYKLPPAAISQIASAAAALVPRPKDGHTPTQAELKPLAVAAQAAYCTGGKCLPKPGPTGATGLPGVVGSPGPAGKPGADAPPVTDAQLKPIVADGIAAYCNQDSKPCDGRRGEQGDKGATGRGITSMTCPDDDNVLTADPWIIRWSDDPVQTEAGVCRAAGIP